MTSPSCDCAYSLIPTVAVSPSFLTHSWVSANRIPLRSAIPTPFPSFRMRPLVEGQRDNLGRGSHATHLHAKAGPRFGQRRWHVGHPDVVAKGEGDVSRGHRADLLAIADHVVAVTGDAAVEHLEAHEPPSDSLLAGPHDGITADEVLVEVEGPIQPCLERIGIGIHVVAVEAHSRFQSARVSSAQARWPYAIGLALVEQRTPEPHGIGIPAEQLEAILAGIAGPRNHARHFRDVPLDEGIVLDTSQVGFRQPLDEADGSWTLHADQRPFPADIEDRAPTLRPDPLEVAILVGGLEHQQIAAVGHRVDEDIIDDAALLVTKQGVLDPPVLEPGHVTSHDALGQARIGDAQLTHVREIEEADGFSHGTMLFADGAVLERHHPATEVRQLGAEADMFLVE